MVKTKKKKIEEKIEIPNGIKVELNKDTLMISKGDEIIKRKKNPLIDFEIKDNKVILSAKNATKRGEKNIGTYKAHIKNIVKGFEEPYKYILKICSGHFPMNASVSNDQFIVKNFLGEKTPRVLKLKKEVKVRVEGDQVIVESANKELAGQTAANIENLCKITNRDPRIFQDGCWIISKDGKSIK